MEDSIYQKEAKKLLLKVRGVPLTIEERREYSIELAALLLKESRRIQTHDERAHFAELDAMIKDPKGIGFAVTVADTCFRSRDSKKTMEQFVRIIDRFGLPQFASFKKRYALKVAKWFGQKVPSFLYPMVKRIIQKESARVILPAEKKPLAHLLAKMKQEGVRINLNRLGEAILGEAQAEKRMALYLKDLERPDVEYISIKISSICSQIHLLSWDETLNILKKRYERLLTAAKTHTYKQPKGQIVPKFINLDMEEYRDLGLTVEIFRQVLDQPAFFRTSAGIVLQSYIPDSYLVQKELTAWAIRRVASGGAPIKIRIVKGANLAMERVEASSKGFKQAPYGSKAEVDANFKKMLLFALKPENAAAVHVGVGSHNLFDIAFALIASEEHKTKQFVEIEMLAGMAPSFQRAVHKIKGSILLYCPITFKEEFDAALSYLIRRLDENTAPDNFLTHLFGLLPGTSEWQKQSNHFSLACHLANEVRSKPNRSQNRFEEIKLKPTEEEEFVNTPDTDWSLEQNRKWLQATLEEETALLKNPIPIVINGKKILRAEEKGISPNDPQTTLYTFSLANKQEIEEAIVSASGAKESWSQTSSKERSFILGKVAALLRERRGKMIAALIQDCGKSASEADTEVSEAIDFAEYYRREWEKIEQHPHFTTTPLGTLFVAAPWNFPCSIALGGIAAALVTGNTVLFKPAMETVYVGWLVASLFWDAGVDRHTLQFIPTLDETGGTQTVQDPRVDGVIVTGATETAKHLLSLRENLPLFAETGGKNTLIVTAFADRDLAIKDIIHSSFSFSGQKCSACSLLILEKEVYQDSQFLEALKDAASSLHVGASSKMQSLITPLIAPPNEKLLKGLTTLEEGESWLLEPQQDRNNPHLWSPGIKLGVQLKSFTYQNELFGPVLGVMCAENLEEAIQLANGTPYGLTGGIHTLSEEEKTLWIKNIEVGNGYINRSITGAIVRRQPFGGCKESHFGPGAKAGGPNYLHQFVRHISCHTQEIKAPLTEEIQQFHSVWETKFKHPKDPSQVLGEENLLYFLPLKRCVVRLEEKEKKEDILLLTAIQEILKMRITISSPFPQPEWAKSLEWREEETLDLTSFERLRLLTPPSKTLAKQLSDKGICPLIAPLFPLGEIELPRWTREFALSHVIHRYGSLLNTGTLP